MIYRLKYQKNAKKILSFTTDLTSGSTSIIIAGMFTATLAVRKISFESVYFKRIFVQFALCQKTVLSSFLSAPSSITLPTFVTSMANILALQQFGVDQCNYYTNELLNGSERQSFNEIMKFFTSYLCNFSDLRFIVLKSCI